MTIECTPISFEGGLVGFGKEVLTFQSLEVSLRTTKFTIQQLYMVLALRSCFVRI
jgi:hypothetical protein